jgi:hypothetical protein
LHHNPASSAFLKGHRLQDGVRGKGTPFVPRTSAARQCETAKFTEKFFVVTRVPAHSAGKENLCVLRVSVVSFSGLSGLGKLETEDFKIVYGVVSICPTNTGYSTTG